MKFISQDGGDGGGSKGERQDEVEFLSVSKRQIRIFLKEKYINFGKIRKLRLDLDVSFLELFFSASYHLTLLAELNVLQRKARAAAFHDRRLKQKRRNVYSLLLAHM